MLKIIHQIFSCLVVSIEHLKQLAFSDTSFEICQTQARRIKILLKLKTMLNLKSSAEKQVL